MHSDFDSSHSQTFIDVAVQRRLLDKEQAETLRTTSAEQAVMSSQIAIEMGLLEPFEVEIVEAFTAPDDLAPGYKLLDVLGYGALGVVYRARQPRLQRDVAIKSIIKSRVTMQNVTARFEQEGAAIGRLHHPNIVSAFDSGSHRNRLYLVMELVKGSDLRQWLDEGPLDIAVALSVVRQTASGLAHAQAHQIIHRDIKPGNLILTAAPAGFDLPPGVPLVKIADFGLARLNPSTGVAETETRLTLTGTALGTPMYCAPEQLSGDDIDHRADIYALGATLFRMLTGKVPFADEKVSKIIAAKVTGQQPRLELLPSQLDPMVRQLLLDMMHPDPDQRVPDYETLIQRVDRIQQPHSSVADGSLSFERSDAKSPRLRRWASSRVMIPAIALFLIAVAASFAVSRFGRVTAEPSLVPSGWETHLFDGKTVTGWTDRAGLWRSGTDAEGGAVLVGKGSAVHRLPEPASVPGSAALGIGVRVGIDLQEADSAEVHYGFRGDDTKKSKRDVVRISRDTVAMGARDGIDGEFAPMGEAVDLSDPSGDGPKYHEVRIELHGRNWFVFFDGELIGDAAADPAGNNQTVQLVASDGDVHFEGPSVYGLTAKAEAKE